MKTRHAFHRSVIGAAALLALTPSAFATDYTFSSGTYTTPNPINAGDVVDVIVGGAKYISSAVTNNGTINASDDLYFTNGNVITNNGLFDWSNDSSLLDGGYNGGLNNTGIFRKSGGTGTSYVSIIGFVSSGTIDVQSGAINFNAGATFNSGSQFTGAGQAVVSAGGSFNGAIASQNLVLAGGSFSGGAAVLSGTTLWTGGTLNGGWTIASGQTLSAAAGSGKYVNGAVTNSGHLNLTDSLYFENGNVVANAGVMDLQGDVSLYDGGYNGGVTNTGVFRKSAGRGTSYVSITGFTNSGTIDVQTGALNFNTGAVFNDGTQFSGAGQALVTAGASFNGSFTTAGNLSLSGGTFTGTGAKINGDLTWNAGTLAGDWELEANRTLNLAAGSGKYLNGSLNNKGTIVATDDLYFQSGNTLTNNGTYTATGDVSLYDGGYNGNFVNNGTYRKASGGGTSYVSITGFTNNGTIDVQSGTVNFNTGVVFNDGSVISGPGQVLVTSGATFNGGFTTASNLSLSGGTFTGNAAKINGGTTWTAGSLTGGWELTSGQTLTLATGSAKYLNGSLVNNGSIVATDDLYFQSGNTLTNNGTYTAAGDVSLYDGGYNGNFINNGTFTKSTGTGTTNVAIIGFSNNGVIEAQTGTINFGAGAAFNNGTQFTGAGQVVVTSGANFAGNFSTANNLTLASGTFNGSPAAPATLTSGSATWTAGSLTGNWQTAGGTTLNIATGSAKYINGSVTNGGTTVATDDLYLQNGNVFTNNGSYKASGDVSLADGGYNGQFINNGSFVKTAGTGTTSVAAIGFVNAGTVDVRSGTIALPTNFSNPGTLTGAGAFATNLLTNSGHVAPGDGAGTLTLNGNFAQTSVGSMDIQLASTSLFDSFNINGSATLDGTLALSCIGGCAIHSGDSFVIVDSTGDLTGTFANVTTLGFGTGFQYSVVYDNADDLVKLQVINAGVMPVPEPSTWALMAGGLAAMAWTARRRRALQDARG
jgi:hypothetical protein